MTSTGRLLGTSFLEDNSHFATELSMEIHNQIYLDSTTSNSSGSTSNVTIHLSRSSLKFATFLDQFLQICCLFLNEQPPSPPTGRDNGRRASTIRQSSANHLSNHLQMDIDRLFAAKIRVFDEVPSDFSTEFLTNTVLKVSSRSPCGIVEIVLYLFCVIIGFR